MYVLLLIFSVIVVCTGNNTDSFPFVTTPTIGPPTAVPDSTPEATEQLPQLPTTGQKATSGGNRTKPRTSQHNTTKSHTEQHNDTTEPPHNTTQAGTSGKKTTELLSTDPATCVGRCGLSTSPNKTPQPENTTPQPENTTPQPRVTGSAAVNTDSKSGTQTSVTDPGTSTTSAPVPIWYTNSTVSSSQSPDTSSQSRDTSSQSRDTSSQSRDSSRSSAEKGGTTDITHSTTTSRSVITEFEDDDTEGDGGGTDEPRTAIPNDKNKGLILAISQVFGALLLLLIFALLALLLFKLNKKTPKPVEGEVIELEAGVFRGGEINSGGVKTETQRDRDSESERDRESERDSNNVEIDVLNKRTAVYSDTLIISNVIRTNELQSDNDKTSSL